MTLNSEAAKRFGPPAKVRNKEGRYRTLSREMKPEDWKYLFNLKLPDDILKVLSDIHNQGYFISEWLGRYSLIDRVNLRVSGERYNPEGVCLRYRLLRVSQNSNHFDDPIKLALFAQERIRN